ncbi:MAG: DNRLRE domain-containing protein, partial [Phycisphaerales bacterium]|nr:DNRLRE domain-containing protein [Phycisphaerales bacterium]
MLAVSSTSAEDFVIVALPDTQKYTESYPEIYDAQTQWCADNAVGMNIKFITHLGDLVEEAATIPYWEIASASMAILDDAGIPYGTCVGNHDLLYPGDYYDPNGTNYLTYFDPQFYQSQPWFRGASPSGLSNYQVVEADGHEWLFMHLLVETPPAELAWAQEVLNVHRDKPTWISTHRYLFDWRILGAGRYDEFNYTFEPPYRPDGVRANDFWGNFVSVNRQVYLVHCGHNDGEYRQVSVNAFGKPVHEVLADYQDTYGNGGNGWLRILTFRPDQHQIDVQTYSPYLNDFRTGDESQFSLAVDFAQYTSDSPLLVFQQGLDGYSGTEDTWVNEDAGGSSYGGSTRIIVDDDTANSLFNEYEGQGLIRFGNLVRAPVQEGEPAPTAIPLGATIVSATLSINLADDTDLGNPQFYVHRMTRNWDESSTWNSLGGGVDLGVDADPLRLGAFAGDNNPDFDSGRSIDVTSAVQLWANGAPNDGFVILPERISFNDDGIEIYSSEDGDPSLRPSLAVEFIYDVENVAP